MDSRLVRQTLSCFLLRWINSSFLGWSYSFPWTKSFPLLVPLSPFNHSRVPKTSQRIRVCVQINSRFSPHSSLWNVPVHHLFLNCFEWCIFEWALTNRSFPRILPDSNFPKLFSNSFSKFDIRMNYRRSYSFSNITFKTFSSLVQHFYSSLFRSVSSIVMVVLVIILNIWRPKKNFS